MKCVTCFSIPPNDCWLFSCNGTGSSCCTPWRIIVKDLYTLETMTYDDNFTFEGKRYAQTKVKGTSKIIPQKLLWYDWTWLISFWHKWLLWVALKRILLYTVSITDYNVCSANSHHKLKDISLALSMSPSSEQMFPSMSRTVRLVGSMSKARWQNIFAIGKSKLSIHSSV